MHRCMEVMVDTFPVVNLYRFNRTHVASQSNDQVLRRMTDLINSINIVILVMDLMHLVQRHYRNRLAIDQFNVINTIQSRINIFLPHLGANVFTVDRYGFIRIRIPYRKVRHLVAVKSLHPLRGESILRQLLRLVAWNEIIRMQADEGVSTHEQRHIGIVFHVIYINEAFVHDDLGTT